jgi:hypothetical protein
VGAVAPVQNRSLSVVGDGLKEPANAELIFILYVETEDTAVKFNSLSMVTVPPDSPLTVRVKAASLSVVANDPAKLRD